VQDAIEARRSALVAAAYNEQAIAYKDGTVAEAAAASALSSSALALITPDMPADLKTIVDAFLETIDEYASDANSAAIAVRAVYKSAKAAADGSLRAAEAEPADKVAAAASAVLAQTAAEQVQTALNTAIAARTAAEAAKTSAEAAITNYYTTTQGSIEE
jgi:hypothetical protein